VQQIYSSAAVSFGLPPFALPSPKHLLAVFVRFREAHGRDCRCGKLLFDSTCHRPKKKAKKEKKKSVAAFWRVGRFIAGSPELLVLDGTTFRLR
jgi:hypothetical protein